jgi:hypothetical protein
MRRLRTHYEFWQDKYRLTHSIHYYSKFQSAFKEYCRLIDSGVVPRSVIDQLSEGNDSLDNHEKGKMLSAKKMTAYWSPHHKFKGGEAASYQQHILDFLDSQKSFLPLEEIIKHIPLSQQYLRDLLADLVNRGILEREKIDNLYHWRKKRDDVDDR